MGRAICGTFAAPEPSLCLVSRSVIHPGRQTPVVQTYEAQASAPSWQLTIGVVFAAALPGLLLLGAVKPLAEELDMDAGLVEYTAHTLVWHLVVLALIVITLPRIQRDSFRGLVSRWWKLRQPAGGYNQALLWGTIAVSAAIAFSSIRLALVDAGWDVLPGPAWSINSPEANRGELGFTISAAVLTMQLLLRIPLTVFVEETLFRGWVLDRHGITASALLFAAYHFSQWWTIAALAPFGLVLALIRVATRSIWPGAIAHWFGNAVYALSLR
jgi:membrane protease YdiL (CAAX protease family)